MIKRHKGPTNGQLRDSTGPLKISWLLTAAKSTSICLCIYSSIFGTSCSGTSGNGSSGSDTTSPTTYQLIFKTTKNINVHVYFEPSAEPFTGTTSRGLDLWSVLSINLSSIVQYRTSQPTITVPNTTSAMTTLSAQNKSSWLATEILALAANNSLDTPSANSVHFKIYFLNGYFNDGTAVSTSTIGVNISGTEVIAVFKDVINSSSSTAAVRKFVEQSTLVHEMGHAMGFVNKGVPMVTNHQDINHGAHTTDAACVMYYLNEGVTDLKAFVANYMNTDSLSMWGSEVLADAKAYSE